MRLPGLIARRIRALFRKDELDASAASRLRPDDLVTVVVGDAAGFADELRAAGLGPVEVISDEG